MIGAAIGMHQPAAASNMTGGPTAIIPPSCPPNTQSFERGVCIGPEPTLTYLCDTDPAGLQLVGGELGPQCVLIDDEGNILYSEPAILVDAECNGPFSFIEETLQCATRPGNQQNRGL